MTSEKFTETAPDPEKIARWEALRARVEQMGDKTGKGMDEGIKEAVVAFLANEFPTLLSCEGHVRERSGNIRKFPPAVDVGVVPPSERFTDKERMKETPEYQAVRAQNRALEKRMEELIVEFYREHPPKAEPPLLIRRVGPSGRFVVEGGYGHADGIAESDVEKYRQNLAKEQEEMATLTAFLKKRFFDGSV